MESTILYWQKDQDKAAAWTVIRLGAMAPAVFLSVLGYLPAVAAADKGSTAPLCPGQMYRHYAPKAELKLRKSLPADASGIVIGFDDRSYPIGCQLVSLGTSTNPDMAAQRLYAILRRLDQELIGQAWVDIDFPHEGLFLTLQERLAKAAKHI